MGGGATPQTPAKKMEGCANAGPPTRRALARIDNYLIQIFFFFSIKCQENILKEDSIKRELIEKRDLELTGAQ